MAAPFLEGPLEAHVLDRLFRTEIAAFQREIEVGPVPVRQDLRAGAVAWIATFAPEVLTEDSRRLLLLTCEAEDHFFDLDTHVWYRTIYLHVAQFALSGHPMWLDVLVTNLDHRTSQLRKSLHAPLGLIAPRLKFTSPSLISRMESSLKAWHFFNDTLLCVYSVLNCSPAIKLAQLIRWKSGLRLAPQDSEVFDSLIKGESISNYYIAGEYFDIVRYLLCRSLEVSPDERPVAGAGIAAGTLWQRMTSHPLTGLFIRPDWREK